jgi:dTDP-4-dehydrorhamnose 3,5-epimerase
MGQITLGDIIVHPLARIPASGGDVFHVLKQSDYGYRGFGEAYFSAIGAGRIKAWKRHKRMTMNIVIPVGSVRFVFRLDQGDAFRTEVLGLDCYSRITVPPGIWFGFQGLGGGESLLLNISDIPHQESEVERLEVTKIEYAWL